MNTEVMKSLLASPGGALVRTGDALRTLSIPLIGPLCVIAVWALAADLNWVSDKLLPGPWATFSALAESVWSGSMIRDAFATLKLTATALGIAMVLGLPIGIVLGSNRSLYQAFEFVIDFFRSTPATAMFPLFLLIFGIADTSKVSVAAFAAWLVFVFNVAYGVMNARQTRILAAKVMGASRQRILRDVMFFESLTQTFVGARMAVSIALVVIIVAEMFIGSINGMGHRIIDAQQVYDLEGMYASILVTGVIGYGLNLIFLGLERWLVHWAGR
ncbi:MAG: ABC transporter permease [Gemmatimonadales bacterium]|nr:ABC transporter permease [Gemmatimonadales bacterium]